MDKNREDAWAVLTEFTENDNLRKHGLAVEVCLRAYARKFGQDEELWGMVGLLHDFDYEKYPEPPEHAARGGEILIQRGWPEEVCQAVLSHVDYTGVPRDTLLKKALFACDELTGFLIAVALVRPSKRIADVKVKSVRKKFKDKAFARAVNREEIARGAEELGVPLDEHIAICLEAMKGGAEVLGV